MALAQPKSEPYYLDTMGGDPIVVPDGIAVSLDRARTPKQIEYVISRNERRLASLYRSGEEFLTCDIAAELMSQVLRKKKIPHLVVMGTIQHNQSHSYIRIGDKTYDPTHQIDSPAADEQLQATFDGHTLTMAGQEPVAEAQGDEDDEEEISDFQKEMSIADPAKVEEFLKDNLTYDSALEMWVILSYSDYTGGAAERSNAAYLLKKYSNVITQDRSDRFNATAVGIHQEEIANITAETLHSLYLDLQTIENEGIIDTASYKQIQVDKIVEAWIGWVAKNFKSVLVFKFPDRNDELDAMAKGNGRLLWGLFDEARAVAGEEWQEQKGADQWINIDPIANAVTPAMLQRWFAGIPQAGHQVESLMEDRKYSCVMAPAPPELTDAVLRWGKMFIGDDELYVDEKEPDKYGLEDEVHVTVKFGLHEAQPSQELLRIIEETQPFEIEVGPCTIFENEKYDVVKFDVDGDGLRKMNRRISELPNSDEHPEYHPHMTVAYVTKGCCHELIGKPLLDPESGPDLRFIVKGVLFSSPNSEKITLFLGKPNLEEGRQPGPLDQFLQQEVPGTSRTVPWQAEQAQKWLKRLLPGLQRAGYKSEIVGSVATRGQSDKDLDILLIPFGRHNVAAAVAVVAANSSSWGRADEDVFNAILPDGRIVEFWFADLQDQINAEENPYADEATEIPEGSLYAGGLHSAQVKAIGEADEFDDEDEMDIEMAKEVYGLPEESFKRFTDADVENFGGTYVRIFADRTDLIDAPLDWQKRGLQQTASGYGAKLTTRYKIAFNDKVYRLYATCYGNASTVWFKNKGRTIVVG